ncbi:hypothetical protein DY000_02053673 [Brassica cretica]|uniref:Uncharacterized protein n=1 Tax=Brassica cretica TaxID=69181 RepID=A0ABQ7ABH8_BRACR|nr:hypothetical protein DY000_02053673 [Brassica cretica]
MDKLVREIETGSSMKGFRKICVRLTHGKCLCGPRVEIIRTRDWKSGVLAKDLLSDQETTRRLQRKGSRQNSRVDELKVVNGNRVGQVVRGLRWNLNELVKAIDGLLRDNRKESGNRKTELDKLSMEEPKD